MGFGLRGRRTGFCMTDEMVRKKAMKALNGWRMVRRTVMRKPAGIAGARREQGQSLLEFALTFPLLLMMLLAIVDFGRAIDALIIVTNAAREGARHASVDSSLTESDVQALVRDQIRGSGTNITTMSNFGDDLANQVQVTITEQSVTVVVTYDFPTWFGGIVRLDTIRIRKQAVMPIL
jgi:Flp pilus assembly protein TadG